MNKWRMRKINKKIHNVKKGKKLWKARGMRQISLNIHISLLKKDRNYGNTLNIPFKNDRNGKMPDNSAKVP